MNIQVMNTAPKKVQLSAMKITQNKLGEQRLSRNAESRVCFETSGILLKSQQCLFCEFEIQP